MTSITTAQSAARRRASAAVMAALFLLSSGCEKKATLMSRPAALSTYNSVRSGGGGGKSLSRSPASAALASKGQPDTPDSRKMIRNGSLDPLVTDAGQSIDKIGSLVTAVGGFIEKSTQTNRGGRSASVTLRVPAARLDQVITQIKGLAISVDRESVEVRDVTREYIDLDARLRNAQAERGTIPSDSETCHNH